MNELILFFGKSFVVSIFLYSYYLLVLRGKKMHAFNRAYLLGSILVSLVVPFLHFSVPIGTYRAAIAHVSMAAITGTVHGEMDTAIGGTHSTPWASILGIAYLTIVVLLIAPVFRKLYSLNRIKKTAGIVAHNGYSIAYTTHSIAPGSFMKTIFWNKSIDMTTKAGQLILAHELCHVQQRHSIDRLLLSLVQAVCWYNPVYWLINKEMAVVHEFLADEYAIPGNDSVQLAEMLLTPQFIPTFHNIHSPFYSSIKRRINMMHENKSTSKWRKVLALPLAAATIMLLSFKVTPATHGSMSAKSPITVILDAGHGGNDNGATTNGYVEKDLNLKLCKKIKELAPEYGITIIETRPDNNYITLDERAKISNAHPGSLFLSIHVNKSYPGNTDKNGVTVKDNLAQNGIELIISDKNPRLNESRMLASAVMAECINDGMQAKLGSRHLHVLSANENTAILAECGNMDNSEDLARLTSENGRELISRKFLNGIATYSSLQKK